MTSNDHPPQPPVEPNDLPGWLHDMTDDEPRQAHAPVEQRVSMLSLTAILLIVGLLSIIGYALYERLRDQPTEGPAPDFSLTVWDVDRLAMAGERLTLETLRGKTVVVNFWASWCIPCQEEAPMFERLWNEYRDREVVFLGVNTEDTDTTALDYIEEYDLSYPHAPDEGGRMEEDYRITGVPETFIINAEGDITRHFEGQPSERDLRDEIERALES